MRRLCALLLAAVLVGTTGCIPSDALSASDNSVAVVLGPLGTSFNPYSSSLASRQMGRAVFSGLMTPGEDLLPRPDLAEEVPTRANGGISSDGRTVTYHIRSGRKWHDGRSVTAHDVAYTIGLQADGRLVDEPGVDVSAITTVTAPDAKTVVVQLSRPAAPLAWRLAPYVLPKHRLAASEDLLSDPFWLKPIGSGPYRFKSGNPWSGAVLVPVKGGGPELVLSFLGDTPSAAKFFAGAGPAVWDSPDAQPAGRERAVEATLVANWARYAFNLDPSQPTSFAEVRRGLRGLLPSSFDESQAARFPYGFRPEPTVAQTSTALRLIGSRLPRGADGNFTWNGRPYIVALPVPLPDDAEGVAFEALEKAWAKLGLLARLEPGKANYYGDRDEAGPLALGGYTAAHVQIPISSPPGWAWRHDPADAPSDSNPGGLNIQRAGDRELDRIAGRLVSAGDPEEAADLVRAALERLEAMDAEFYLYPLPQRALVRGVSGVSVHPVNTELLSGASAWRVEGAGR